MRAQSICHPQQPFRDCLQKKFMPAPLVGETMEKLISQRSKFLAYLRGIVLADVHGS
jgi:hypothetical protein